MTPVPASPAASAPWTVLLIGGSSGTGKTTLAEAIGRTVGVPWLQAADVRLALQRITRPSQQPALHAFLAESVWQRPSEELRDRFIAVGEIVSHALEIVVANHVATDAPLVLEGDGIVPAMASLRTFAGLEVGDLARAVFLVEPDEAVILRTMQDRRRGIDRSTEPEQRTQAHASWLYGQWLRTQAERHGLPVVEARPWATLADRVRDIVGMHPTTCR